MVPVGGRFLMKAAAALFEENVPPSTPLMAKDATAVRNGQIAD